MVEGLRVVEIGDSVAAGSAGSLLARLGADVTRIARPSRAPGETQKNRLREILERGKHTVELDDPFGAEGAKLARQADLTIVDLMEMPDAGLESYEEFVRRTNTACWVTVSPFGLTGPLRANRGSELTVAAAGGMARYMRSSDGRPMKPAGFTTSVTAGHYAVLAGLHALLLRRDGGDALHMDVSAQDTVIVTGVFLECAHRLFECGGEGGASRYAAPRGLVPCGEGFIWIVVLEDHQWRACVDAMGNPEWAASIRTAADRHAHNEWIQERVAEWASGLTAREAADRLQRCGAPATPVNSCADLLDGVGRDVRSGFFAQRGDERLPDQPFEAIVPPREAAAPPVRARYRLLDLTQVLVGPLATSWLGAMGVDVLKIEDPARVDIYRRSGPFLNDEAGIERSAYFAIANYSKRSHALALQSESGRERLGELIASADVVVHNLVHRAVALGITPETVHGELGSFIVSCSGYARETANGAYRAYGMNIQAAGGVVHLSRDRHGRPTNLGTSWADPLSSIWLAIMTLVQLLKPAQERASIDVSMVEVVAHEFREFFQAESVDGVEIVADESRLDHAAPHGVYRARGDDRWLALAVEDDAGWASLVAALGRPDELARPHWEDLRGRLRDQDALDQALDRVLAERDVDELFAQLQRVGVACAPVWSAADLVELEHLHARRLLQPVAHPVWGERPLIGLPWLVDGAAAPITATPVLGADTTDDPEGWWLT